MLDKSQGTFVKQLREVVTLETFESERSDPLKRIVRFKTEKSTVIKQLNHLIKIEIQLFERI